MLKIFLFIVAWVISTTVISTLINISRAKNGQNINDSTTAFFEGVVWGPIAILSSFNPQERALGRSTGRMIGGVTGCIVGYFIFISLGQSTGVIYYFFATGIFLVPIFFAIGGAILRPSSRILRTGPLQYGRSAFGLALLFAGGGVLGFMGRYTGIPSSTTILAQAIVFGGIGLVLGGIIDLLKFFRSRRTTETQNDEYIVPPSSVAPPLSDSVDLGLTSAFCTECGQALQDQAKFCSSCGTAVLAGSAAYSAPVPKIKGKVTAPEPADTNAPDPDFSEPSSPMEPLSDEAAEYGIREIGERYVLEKDGQVYFYDQLYDAITDAKNSRRGSATSKGTPARELPKTASEESGQVPKDNTILKMFGLVGLAVLFIVFLAVLSSPQDTAQDTSSEGDGLVNLGYKYDIGDGVEEDNVEAVRLYRLAAEKGNARGQYYLGTMYDNGEGVPRNTIEAAKWYRFAAEHGYSTAQFDLGLMFETGEGVPRNTIEAAKWYRLAAEQGNADARERLAEMGF